jgi:hypothetical protein
MRSPGNPPFPSRCGQVRLVLLPLALEELGGVGALRLGLQGAARGLEVEVNQMLALEEVDEVRGG